MGIGGHLMWTPVVRTLHVVHNKKVYLENNDGGGIVWENNPYITLISQRIHTH